MAIGLFLLTITWSLSQHQVWWRACITGALARAALSCSVFKRATILSNTSRAVYSNGKLMNHLSTDISRIDYACMWMPSIPSAVPQVRPLARSRSHRASSLTSSPPDHPLYRPSLLANRTLGPRRHRLLRAHHSCPVLVDAALHQGSRGEHAICECRGPPLCAHLTAFADLPFPPSDGRTLEGSARVGCSLRKKPLRLYFRCSRALVPFKDPVGHAHHQVLLLREALLTAHRRPSSSGAERHPNAAVRPLDEHGRRFLFARPLGRHRLLLVSRRSIMTLFIQTDSNFRQLHWHRQRARPIQDLHRSLPLSAPSPAPHAPTDRLQRCDGRSQRVRAPDWGALRCPPSVFLD